MIQFCFYSKSLLKYKHLKGACNKNFLDLVKLYDIINGLSTNIMNMQYIVHIFSKKVLSRVSAN